MGGDVCTFINRLYIPTYPPTKIEQTEQTY